MKKILIIFLFINSCSFIPTSPANLMMNNYDFLQSIEEQSHQYPYWNIDFLRFNVLDQDPQFVNNPTPEQKIKARTLTINDKVLMFQNLSFLRFALNTPEFASNLLKTTFNSSVNAKGPKGIMVKGKPLDSKRLLEILQKRSYAVEIRKGVIAAGAAAVGVVGRHIYVLDDNDPQAHNSYWLAFPNSQNWSTGGYLKRNYITTILFHEMLHNSGFSHTVPNDATYGIANVFGRTVGDPKWKQKYQKQLTAFISYYGNQYKEWLLKDTIAIPKKKTRSLESLTYRRSIQEDVEICILDENGNHSTKKVRINKELFL